jgi:hypothetical protein
MLTHHCLPVCLSWLSTDLPVLSSVETNGTLYQKDSQRFHLLLNQLDLPISVADLQILPATDNLNQLLWLEISPYRVIMTMQGRGKFAYRHFWEQGIYGVSRYWLNGDSPEQTSSFRLQNYTRSLTLQGGFLPEYLRVEYELWTHQTRLGNYVLHLEVYN